MNSVIINVHTEYQFLCALSVIKQYYSAANFKVYLNIIQPTTTGRFNFQWNFDVLENVIVKFYDIDQYKPVPQADFAELLSDLRKIENIVHFVLFNRLSFVSLYLLHKVFSKNEVKIYLGPDGAAAYTFQKRFAPLWAFNEFIALERFFMAQGIYSFIPHFPTLNYAQHALIENLYLPHIKGFVNTYKKNILQFGLLDTTDKLNEAAQVFNFNFNNFSEKNDGIIFYCNQPFYDAAIYEYELKFLHQLVAKFGKDSILIKFHPSTEKMQKEKILNTGISLIESSYPAELFVASLKNSSVISFWSTVNLYYHPENTSYWLYPLLEKEGIMNKTIGLNSIDNHIKLVYSFDEIN